MPPIDSSPLMPAAVSMPEHLPGVIFSFHDGQVTWRNETAARILVSARTSEVNFELLRNLLHGLVNTITGIHSSAEVLKQVLDENGISDDTLDAILGGSLDAREQVQTIGMFLRESDARSEYFDLREQVEYVIDHLRRGVPRNVSISVACEAKSGTVCALLHDFRIAVANLLTNAVAAMSEGGELSIQIVGEGDFLHLRFVDTGCGIPSPRIDGVIDPLYTTRAGRSAGLGLAQVQAFARASGGDVRLESREGEGTTAILILPAP